MKYIFDFDDVLFKTTAGLKPRIFTILARHLGASDDSSIRAYYAEMIKQGEFSLKKFIETLGIRGKNRDALYAEIMENAREFVNQELLDEIKKYGRENCYIVTNGGRSFNTDKLKYSGIWNMFDQDKIHIVPGPKHDKVAEICAASPADEFVFVDDKENFINEFKAEPKIKNLRTIHHKIKNSENPDQEVSHLIRELRKLRGENGKGAQEVHGIH